MLRGLKKGSNRVFLARTGTYWQEEEEEEEEEKKKNETEENDEKNTLDKEALCECQKKDGKYP